MDCVLQVFSCTSCKSKLLVCRGPGEGGGGGAWVHSANSRAQYSNPLHRQLKAAQWKRVAMIGHMG